MSNLIFATWNATGVMFSASYAGKLLTSERIHIFGISEHWLNSSNLHFLQSIHKDYQSYGVIDRDNYLPGRRPMGKGGVAFMWHKSLNNSITTLDIDSDRMCGIQYRICSNRYIYFIQVYAPCSNYPVSIYRDFVDLLQTVISTYTDHGIVIVMGDMNAHLQGQRFIKATDYRGEYLLGMMNYFNLTSVNTQPLTSGASASFVSYGGLYESLIDHILLPTQRLDTVVYCTIQDDDVLNVSRHRPVICCLQVPQTDLICEDKQSHFAWHKLDQSALRMYEAELSRLLTLQPAYLGTDIESCIDSRYNAIIDCVKAVSDSTLPKTSFRPYLKPYWSRVLKDLHAVMREKRRNWIFNGRPRGCNNSSYNDYKQAKRLFRSQHRVCAENYLIEINAEIDQAAEVDSGFFWKKVNSRRQQSQTHAGSELRFDDKVCRDPEDIVSGWGCYFQKLYSESNSPMFDPVFKNDVDVKMRHIINELPGVCTQEQVIISKDDVRKAARQLKCRKACGYDGIFNEHLKNGGIKLHEELALLYTDMYNHGHIPEGLKKGIIITLHKGGRKSKSDPNNYRAITLTSCILKLFERILLQQVEASLNTPLNMLQGGFRAGLSCNMSSLMLKECISFTKENHSKLFVCFLDVQKAFDCVWHNGLFVKLYQMGIRSNLLRVL